MMAGSAWGFNLRIERGQYQAQRPPRTELQEVLLQILGGSLSQIMQRCDRAVLIKVGHGLPPLPALLAHPYLQPSPWGRSCR